MLTAFHIDRMAASSPQLHHSWGKGLTIIAERGLRHSPKPPPAPPGFKLLNYISVLCASFSSSCVSCKPLG